MAQDLEATTPEPDLEARARRSALVVVFLVVVIDLLGFGIVMPLLPRYGDEFLEPIYAGPDNASFRGMIVGLLMSSFSLMQFLFAPLWGRLSDRIGRRPVLLIGLVGSVIFYALFGIGSELGSKSAESPGNPQLGIILLFVARIGAGIAGATLGTAQAVIADSTSPENRKRGMALIGIAFGVGFTFGPALGALAFTLVENRGAAGYAAAVFSLIALLVGLARMPETWKPGISNARKHWFDWSGMRTALTTRSIGLLIIIFFLSTFAFATFEPTLAYLTRDLLRYGDQKNYLVFTYVGFVLTMANGAYQGIARRGVQETSFMLAGCSLMGLGLGLLGLQLMLVDIKAETVSWPVLLSFLLVVTVAVTGFACMVPSVQALISRRSDPARQGEILGTNQSINAIARILGPMSGVSLYESTPYHVGPFVLSVVFLALSFVLTLKARQD